MKTCYFVYMATKKTSQKKTAKAVIVRPSKPVKKTNAKPTKAVALKELKKDIKHFEAVVEALFEKGIDSRLENIFVAILKRRASRLTQKGKKPLEAISPQQEFTILAKLRADWSIGATDREACIGAGISPFSLSRYLKENPELKEYRNELRETPILTARRSVVGNLEKDYGLAFRFLQSKKPKEFAIGRFASGDNTDTQLSKEEEESAKEAFSLL